MKYLAGLRDLHGTVKGAAQVLNNVNQISGHLAGVIMQRRMQQLRGLGDFSASEPLDIGAAVNPTSSQSYSGEAGVTANDWTEIVSVKPSVSPPGGTITTYSDGSVVITNNLGVDVTSAFTNPGLGVQTPAQMAASSLADAASNAAGTAAAATSTALKATLTALMPVIVVGVIGVIAIMLIKAEVRK